MTIYTDKVTGKKYDRVPGGVGRAGYIQGYKSCSECAFGGLWGEACARAVEHCVSGTNNKPVFFVFKERKA